MNKGKGKRPTALKELTKKIVAVLERGDNPNTPPTLDMLRERHPQWYFDAYNDAQKVLSQQNKPLDESPAV